MKRYAILIALIVMFAGFAIATATSDETAPLETEAIAPDTPIEIGQAEGETCSYRTAEQLLDEFRATRVEESGIQDCPETHATCSGQTVVCQGNNPCYVTTSSSSADTGLKHCRLPDGTLFNCAAQLTIHITSRACAQCPCCYGPPPNCFCPSDCQEVVTLTCQ